jgi:hypothetical protein
MLACLPLDRADLWPTPPTYPNLKIFHMPPYTSWDTEHLCYNKHTAHAQLILPDLLEGIRTLPTAWLPQIHAHHPKPVKNESYTPPRHRIESHSFYMRVL